MLKSKLTSMDDWALAQPYILMALRAAVSKTTGFSPFELVYGRKFVLPHEAGLLKQDRKDWPLYAKEFMGEVEERLKLLREVALKNSLHAQEEFKEAYDNRYRAVNKPAFQPGDLVLLRELHLPSDAKKKMVPAYKKQVYRIEKTVRADEDCHTYILADAESGVLLRHPYNEFHLKRYTEQDGTIFTKSRMFKMDTVQEEEESDRQDEEPDEESDRQDKEPDEEQVRQEEQTREAENTEDSESVEPEKEEQEQEQQESEEQKPGEEQWYEIDRIISARQSAGRTEYKVRWKGLKETDWIHEDDVTEKAKRIYLATHTKQGKKRKRNKNVDTQ
jgi:hypothetical protein